MVWPAMLSLALVRGGPALASSRKDPGHCKKRTAWHSSTCGMRLWRHTKFNSLFCRFKRRDGRKRRRRLASTVGGARFSACPCACLGLRRLLHQVRRPQRGEEFTAGSTFRTISFALPHATPQRLFDVIRRDHRQHAGTHETASLKMPDLGISSTHGHLGTAPRRKKKIAVDRTAWQRPLAIL